MANKTLTDSIRGHFTSLGRRKVEVPEWDNLVIWVSPLTLREKSVMQGWHEVAKAGEHFLVFARIIVMKAEDEAGNKLFKDDDYKLFIDEADPDIVSRVGQELVQITEVDEAKKS